MDIEKYILSLTSAALLCAIATGLVGKKSALGVAVALISGIYMTLTIVAPWGQLRLGELEEIRSQISTQGRQYSDSGQNAAREAMATSIIANTQSYILDKAETFGAELTVEVMLDDSPIPAPCQVRIRGKISPYNREALSNIIQRDLGIPTEAQIWM